jgi:copper homeostasis protein
VAEVALEVCVDCAEGLEAAIAGGADRIELCAALAVGGLTPSRGLMQLAARCGVPVHAMIRPRAGNFVFSTGDIAVMCEDIAAARAAGLAGVVLGASILDGRLNETVLADLADQAAGLQLTLHRAVDLVPDIAEALDVAVKLGFHRVLTSGGGATVTDGLARLHETFRLAAGRIIVLPGSGVSAETFNVLKGLPLREVHASCSVEGMPTPLGFGAPRRTDAARVAALKAALRGWPMPDEGLC